MFICSRKKYSSATMSMSIVVGLLAYSSAQALTVTSGQLIQTVQPQELLKSSSLTVSTFFDESRMAGLMKKNIREDSVSGSTQVFSYAVHSPDFRAGHPNRVAGVNSYPSEFSFDPDNFMSGTGKRRIGLGGVVRYDLPARPDGTPRYFVTGDFTMEFDPKRQENYNYGGDSIRPINPRNHGVSGWIMRNHFDFPAITYDVINPTVLTNSDSFYLAGQFAWSPEMSEGFLTDDALYKVVSDFVMCGQDDNALASNSVRQIPCVFPKITINNQDGVVRVNPTQNIKLSVDLGIATANPVRNADYFAVFIHNDVAYWLNQNFQWTTTVAAAYQGSLLDFRSIAIPSPKLPTGSLPSGSEIEIFFGVDAIRNGKVDEPYRLSSAKLKIN